MADLKHAEKKCLFVINQGAPFKAVNEHIKSLNGFYNGAGWYVENKHKDSIYQIIQNAKLHCIDFPLSESFTDLKRRHNKDFFLEKSIKIRLQIDNLKSVLGISNLETDKLIQKEFRSNLEKTQEGKKLVEHVEEHIRLKEQIKRIEEEERISNLSLNKISIVPIIERIKSHKESIEKYRGKKYLGLCVKTINEFNEKMLGLRKLILLAAAPNVGKTALTIQLAMEVLLTESDACLVYISLEMDAEEIFTRINLYHSGLNFDTYVLGSQQIVNENQHNIFFTEDELNKINTSEKIIAEIGNRLQIIDTSTCPNINANIIVEYVERLKNETKCNRAIVVIDYLQVWPMPKDIRFTSDIEADKWRIGEIKKIRDALNTVNQDPVIVISEARKPSSKDETWGGDLSDVMGSARGTYTPDAVWLLSQLSSTQLNSLWKEKQMPDITYKEAGNDSIDPKDEENIKGFLAHHGIALCNLKMPKGRDGMKKFNILLAFHFNKNKFSPIDWQSLLGIAMSEKNKNQSSSNFKKYDKDGHEIICKLKS